MKYSKNKVKDEGVRYLLTGGKFVKMYLVSETDNGVYLRRKKIIDTADIPQLFPQYQVYKNRSRY